MGCPRVPPTSRGGTRRAALAEEAQGNRAKIHAQWGAGGGSPTLTNSGSTGFPGALHARPRRFPGSGRAPLPSATPVGKHTRRAAPGGCDAVPIRQEPPVGCSKPGTRTPDGRPRPGRLRLRRPRTRGAGKGPGALQTCKRQPAPSGSVSLPRKWVQGAPGSRTTPRCTGGLLSSPPAPRSVPPSTAHSPPPG